MKTLGVYKNGNYNVRLLADGTKIRETNEDEFIPAFAENCDCKITDKCDGGCPFCYEGCTPNGKHGDILNYKFLDTLHPYTELAINGNDMSHPDLIPLLEKLKEKKVVANMTVSVPMGDIVKEVELVSVFEDVLGMDSWVDFTKQAPPIEEEVDLKFIQNGEEKIITDKLIPMMNGTYMWSYGDYSGCEVIAWKKKIPL